jgi:hypothetical protein
MTRWFCCSLLTLAILSSGCVQDDIGVEASDRDLARAPSCPPADDPSCIPGELVDVSPAPGVQPECAVSVFLAADEEPLEHVVPPCALTGHAPPCFEAVLDRDVCPGTPSGLRMEVLHAWGDDVVDVAVECVQRRPRRPR